MPHILVNGLTNSKGTLIAASVSNAANVVIQYGFTGKIKLADVFSSGIIGLITAEKGYNPTVTWNAIGGYYTAELKGGCSILGVILSKASSSIGSATGASIQIPMNKFINPISKKYEWFPTGVWTITKLAPKKQYWEILPIPPVVS